MVIETNARIASREDEDVSALLQKILEGEKVEFRLNAKVTRVKQSKGGKIVRIFDDSNDTKTLSVSHLFVATGRKPHTDDLGLANVGVGESGRRTGSRIREFNERRCAVHCFARFGVHPSDARRSRAECGKTFVKRTNVRRIHKETTLI